MLNTNLVAAISLGSTWLASTLALLFPSKRIALPPASQDENENSHSSEQQRLKEKYKGRIIFEAQFKHQLSKARILLCLFGFVLLVSRSIQTTYAFLTGEESSLIQYEIADILIWFNFLVIGRNLSKSLSFSRCIHLALLPSFSLLFQVFQASSSSEKGESFYYGQKSFPIVPVLIRGFFMVLSFANLMIASTVPMGPRRAWSPRPGVVPAKEFTDLSSEGVSILSRLWFAFCFQIIFTIKRNGKLTAEDIPYLDASRRSEVLLSDFEFYLQDEKRKLEMKERKKVELVPKASPWPLTKSMIKGNWFILCFITLSAPLMALSFYAPAFFLNCIVHFLEINELSTEPDHHTAAYKLQQGGIWCLALTFTLAVGAVLQNSFFSYVGELLVRLRIQINTIIFAKTLRKKDVSSGSGSENAGNGESGKGEQEEDFKSKAQVIQLSSVDSQRVAQFALHYFSLALFPCEVLIGGTFIYRIMGASAIVGIALSLITGPLISFIAKKKGGVQRKLSVERDKRTPKLNEAFAAIRMIKFAAWEQKIQDGILKIRSKELFYLRMSFGIDAILNSIFVITPNLSILVTFGWFVFVQKEVLRPSVAFSAIAVLLKLRITLSYAPELISAIISSWVSLRRISTYLNSEEVDLISNDSSDGALAIRSATIGWPVERASTPAASPFKLRDISVEFDQGKLNLVTGRLGTGKSLLLLALLHEAEISWGHVEAPRSAVDAIKGDKDGFIPPSEWIRKDLVAYTPQNSFLINASIKDNILFGLPLDDSRYQETLTACQLRPDLDQLEDGDETEIGENGIGISGGQQARVSIARAFYSRASTLLLDDVLSAVDASTASRLVSDLLIGPLAQDRTIILVSHQVQLCAPIASKLVLLNDQGRIGFDGSANSFLKSELYAGLHEDEAKEESANLEASSLKDEAKDPEESSKVVKTQASPKKLVKDEKIGEGSIKFSVYKAYFREAGWPLCIFTAIFLIAVNLWPGVTASWLREWSSDSVRIHREHVDLWFFKRLAALYLIEVGLAVISFLLLISVTLRASNRYFKLVLGSVFAATLRFHDTVSRGRLLNRFGSDFQSVDEELAPMLKVLISNLLDLILHVAVVWFANGVFFLVMFFILLPVYSWVGFYFSAAMRDLRRIESAARSPLANAFTDLVSGMIVVRAFGAQSHTLNILAQRSDASSQAFWYQVMITRWMNILFDTFSTILIFFSSLYILVKPDMDSATAAFALSFLISIFSRLLWTTMKYADVQQRLVSVERIVEYATELDSEPPSVMKPPPKTWPQGEIVAKDLSLRYAPELPEVLKKVNFTIKRGQKIALVGSTGSGKTSLATALFRFTDPSSGSIEIDGIDITQVGLQDLRSRIQIIPQDPTILSGSLRQAIDPFDEHSDAEILNVLRAVRLTQSSTLSALESASLRERQSQDSEVTNANVFQDLSYPVAEGGSNLSNGQRQLICLARALLKKAAIIVLDEATSSIDNETEEALSQTIREAFAEATVLTIAHRLRTIANYDLVMVMDQGSIVEMDTPKVLLDRPNSKFYALCRAAGKAELEHLKTLAGAANS